MQRSMEVWAGCIAGALHQRDFGAKLTAAGFAQPEVQRTRRFNVADLDARHTDATTAPTDGGSCCGDPTTYSVSEEDVAAAEGALASAFIRATKPAVA